MSFNEHAYVYSADLSDGVTFTSIGFRVPTLGLSVPEAVVDAAAQAFFQEMNANYLPVTSATKSTEGVEQDTFDWDGA